MTLVEGDKLVYTGTINCQTVSSNVPTGGSDDEPASAPGCMVTSMIRKQTAKPTAALGRLTEAESQKNGPLVTQRPVCYYVSS